MSLSFVQYKYCSLCRTSCKKIKKHVHSPRHQEIVKNILRKFLKKISDAKGHLDNPVAKDANWSDVDRKVWCYFCSCDVDLHLGKTTIAGDCVIVSAGFLGHIIRKDHSENTAKFLKDNVVDMKRTPEFLLDHNIFLKFLEKAEKVSVDFLTEKNRILKKSAHYIMLQKEFSHRIAHQGRLEQVCENRQRSRNVDLKPPQEEARGHRSNDSQRDLPDSEKKKTIQAFGAGLTVIERSNEDDSQGNIHSYAVPPWLRKDEEEESDGDKTIGPSIADWMKHKKLEQKSKLPSCRVGAKFDRKTSQGDEWLPNFGGVWSHGPRTKAGKHFMKRNSPYQKHMDRKEHVNKSDSDSRNSISPSVSFHDNKGSDCSTHNSNSFHGHIKDESFRQYNHQTENNQLFSSRFIGLPSTSNSHTPYGDFTSLNNSDNSYVSTLPLSTTVKPYVSKRRKVGQSSSTCTGSRTIASHINSIETFRPEESFSPHAPKATGYERDNIHKNPNSSHPATSSPLRLLPTPVLTKKK